MVGDLNDIGPETFDPDALLAADPELARLGDLLAKAATGEVDRASARAEVLAALARRAADDAPAPAPVSCRLADLTPNPWDRMVARADGLESCLPVPWGDVATILDPYAPDGKALRPGVHVLVGGTGSGKTQLALALALAAARDGHPVFYVGLELDPVSVTARLASLIWDTDKRPLTKWKTWSVLDWPRTPTGVAAFRDVRAAVADELAALPIRLVFGEARSADGGFTVADLGAVFTEAADAGTVAKPALVVVDFLQLLAPVDGNPEDREIRTRIARASYAASNAARDGKVAVLLVSATARENYKELEMEAAKLKNVKSLVGLGKESGEIEYAATSVLVIAKIEGFPETLLVGVAKNRHGLTGWAALDWQYGSWPRAAPGRLEEIKAAAKAKAIKDAIGPAPKATKAKNAGRNGAPGGGFDPK